MTNQELFISHISRLSEDEISSLLDAVNIMLRDKELTHKPACPHCAAQSVIRYGFKCKKQRFLCKNCGHTFFAATVNMAKPSAKELVSIFEGHIADGTLALCDGLRSYHALPGIADCTVRDCVNQESGDAHFFNLNTVNGFHSFIKKRYDFYRGVASKYINRYNVLFAAAYRNAESIIGRLTETVLAVTSTGYYHSNKDVRTAGMLVI